MNLKSITEFVQFSLLESDGMLWVNPSGNIFVVAWVLELFRYAYHTLGGSGLRGLSFL